METRGIDRPPQSGDIQQWKSEVDRNEIRPRRGQRFCRFARVGPGNHHLSRGPERILQNAAPFRAAGDNQAMKWRHDSKIIEPAFLYRVA